MRALLLRLVFLLGLLPGATRGAEPALPPPSSAGPVLYLFAHQDDEVFILGKMRREIIEGREVHALWITDGSAHGQAVKREQESRAVMERVGVPPSRLYFLGFPDHASFRHLDAIRTRIMPLARSRPFAELVSPAYEGGHIDHDVTALMAAVVAAELLNRPAHFEFPLYNHYKGKSQFGVFLPAPNVAERREMLEPDRQKFVSECLDLYHSQWVLLTVLEIVGHKKAVLARGEPYRLAPSYDFLHRPAEPEKCGYEITLYVHHRVAFTEWTKAVEPFLAARAVGAR